MVSSGTTTNAVGKMGGALATPAKLLAVMRRSNQAWIKASTTYSIAASLAGATAVMPSPTVPWTKIMGYGTTRGDGVKLTLQATAASVTMLNLGVVGTGVENFMPDGNNQPTSQSYARVSQNVLINTLCKNFKFRWVQSSNLTEMLNVEVGPSAATGT